MLEGLLQGVFVDNYEHALDAKRRLTVPSAWRDAVGGANQLIVLPGIGTRCLYVYTAQELGRRLQKLKELSVADQQAQHLIRQIASRAESVSWDSQGRIRIKDELLTHAGIERDVTLSGAFDRFELWEPEEFKRMQKDGDDPSKLAEAARYVGF
jgi:MraZ protein